MKITSPIDGFTGTTYLGPLTLEFQDGVAEADDLSDGARLYLTQNGYGLGSKQPSPVEDASARPDSRDYDTPEQFGARLRDAAVDPQPGDFLAPTNAGTADPHGPDVVSPEVHASQGVRPVAPGDVHVDDTDAQDAAETEHAAAATDGTPVDDGTTPEPEVELKGQALDDALEARGLPKTGTADEKRARVAEYDAQAQG